MVFRKTIGFTEGFSAVVTLKFTEPELGRFRSKRLYSISLLTNLSEPGSGVEDKSEKLENLLS